MAECMEKSLYQLTREPINKNNKYNIDILRTWIVDWVDLSRKLWSHGERLPYTERGL